jgi:hypothetical protein
MSHTLPRHTVTIDGENAQIGTAAELATALGVLQGRHDRAVMEQLRPHLADIIAAPQGLSLTLKALAPTDQLFLIESLGGRLLDVVQSANHLRDLFATLASVGVEEEILKTLGTPGLRRLLMTAEDLAETLEWIYGDGDKMALELLGADYLRGLFHTGYELSLVLNALDARRQAQLLEMLGWERVVALVLDGRDLAQLLRALRPNLSKKLLAQYDRTQLVNLIHNDKDWQDLIHRLEDAEAKNTKSGVTSQVC